MISLCSWNVTLSIFEDFLLISSIINIKYVSSLLRLCYWSWLLIIRIVICFFPRAPALREWSVYPVLRSCSDPLAIRPRLKNLRNGPESDNIFPPWLYLWGQPQDPCPVFYNLHFFLTFSRILHSCWWYQVCSIIPIAVGFLRNIYQLVYKVQIDCEDQQTSNCNAYVLNHGSSICYRNE